jgi:hypothetical protein
MAARVSRVAGAPNCTPAEWGKGADGTPLGPANDESKLVEDACEW